MRSWKRHTLVLGLLSLLFSLTAFSLWLAGCTANEPFDPEILDNHRPVARLFVALPEDGDLNTTSYFNRSFSWSGTDRDGFVTEFYISIRNDADIPAPWDTTITTDTTMTFITGDEGEVDAVFLLACRDNRGALSDTVSLVVPMRNHPPTVGFQSDFEPLQNFQREFIYDGEAVVDTVIWNWGISTFELNAFDLDGLQTMDSFFRYTMVDGDPDQTWDVGDPAADPEVGWIRVPFGNENYSHDFIVQVEGLAPGPRTLTVSVGDEGGADPRFQYSWEVRAPKSSVLNVMGSPALINEGVLFGAVMDSVFGEGEWDRYDFSFGYPENDWVLLKSMQLFDLVLWADGSSISTALKASSSRDGPLEQYVLPIGGAFSGNLMLISPTVAGMSANGPSAVFISNVLGINASAASPQGTISSFMGHDALGDGGGAYLPTMTGTGNFGRGVGMDPDEGTEVLYRMEECFRCYGTRPPFDPVIGIRRPHRDDSPLASVVCFSVQLNFFQTDQVVAALKQVLIDEMGVVAP